MLDKIEFSNWKEKLIKFAETCTLLSELVSVIKKELVRAPTIQLDSVEGCFNKICHERYNHLIKFATKILAFKIFAIK